ncbi:cysteine and histidine-rich protein 1-like [Anneissia japonica]|uniref:cysteine and histidine-rich protein 1-like n=1 Tax=Anneissia japonica TaxID=1529436 RepID=UPI001425609E|nr:cysteine and histidine-rich protein 1-like [Anneissia japonica]
MASEPAVSSVEIVQEVPNSSVEDDTNIDLGEPVKKKIKSEEKRPLQKEEQLEERLNGILCCSVCLDLPTAVVYQCINGHLMCAGCFTHLLADARLKDETATCPNCRCEINKNLCSRNLAVEKAISELPSECQYCLRSLPRNMLERHEKYDCLERLTKCQYQRIGCNWQGTFHKLADHEEECSHPKKTGVEVMKALDEIDRQAGQELKMLRSIFDLLSFEKITYHDLQLKPYRTDDFITRLYYETGRFSALSQQWVIKARVNDDHRNPTLMWERKISYQLILKSKINSTVDVHFVVLKGPFGDAKIKPLIHRFDFSSDKSECPYNFLPLLDSNECNKLLSAKTINFRVIMFQVPK